MVMHPKVKSPGMGHPQISTLQSCLRKRFVLCKVTRKLFFRKSVTPVGNVVLEKPTTLAENNIIQGECRHNFIIYLSAETPMPDDFLCDPPVDSKRYAVDPSDSAFNVMASQYSIKHSYSYRGSSCSTSGGICRQASSPGSFQDGNRNGEC